MLDGKAVSPGQMVDATSKQLTIPNKGYAGVVTIDGFAEEFNGTIRISDVLREVRLGNRPRRGAIYTDYDDISVVSMPGNQFAFILGDSILLAIKDYRKTGYPYYFMDIINMFEDYRKCDSVIGNWKAIEVGNFIRDDEAILVGAKLNFYDKSRGYLIRIMPPALKARVLFDISRISELLTKNELLLAVYQLNELYHDQVFLLYQLERSNYQPQSKIFANYIAQQKKKYQFELFDFHK